VLPNRTVVLAGLHAVGGLSQRAVDDSIIMANTFVAPWCDDGHGVGAAMCTLVQTHVGTVHAVDGGGMWPFQAHHVQPGGTVATVLHVSRQMTVARTLLMTAAVPSGDRVGLSASPQASPPPWWCTMVATALLVVMTAPECPTCHTLLMAAATVAVGVNMRIVLAVLRSLGITAA
jgi:hypothetical protein